MKSTFTKRINSVLALLLTIVALAAGQRAMAETKAVTYTITSVTHNSTTNTYNIVFTRSGVAFNTSAPTNFSTSVSSSSIGQSPGNSGSFLVSLADGFKINVSWESGSNVGFDDNNYISPGANGKQITYNVSCTDETYYVTHVEMWDSKGAWIDQDYANQWRFAQNYASAHAFGKITITYANTPPLSVFQSAGTNTYNIRNKEELRHLANYVNGGNNCDGLTFLQTQNITYNVAENNYTPIGYKNSYFRGTYNGQGNTVSGINVSRTGSGDAEGYIGLFGHVGAGGIVQNVILDNSSFVGYTNVGGIVGRLANGTVQNCQVTNSVNITNVAADATNFGGIVGKVELDNANVIGCISAANVTGKKDTLSNWFGGIVGYLSSGTIKDCLYTGTSVDCDKSRGAILGGMNNGTLSNNYHLYSRIYSVNIGNIEGARYARTVTLGENITLVGDETPYSVSGLTAIGTTALRHGSTIYSGEGQTLTLTYTGTPAAGYEFSGFSATGGATVSGNTLTMPARDVTVNATFSPIVYTITYHTDGGSLSNTYNTYTIESADITLKKPTKAGLTFFGWYDNESLTGEPVTTIPTGSTGNKEFWAKFRKDIADCTVTMPDQALGSHSYINYKFWDAPATIGETVKDGETTLVLGTDYEFGSITYADMTGHDESDMPEHVGDECIVTINGIGDYAGSITATFTIVNPSGSGSWGDNLSWSLADGTLSITGTGAMNAAASNEDYPWFDYKSYIYTITIGEGITSIANGAFATAFNDFHYTVSTVNLPSSLTSIGEEAFAYCTGATITIPSGATIGDRAFQEVNKVIGSLSDNADNTGLINRMYEAKKADVTLAGRTLYQDNNWNTLCLPFNLVLNGSPLEGATLMELDVEGYYDGNTRYTESGGKYIDDGGREYTGAISALRQTGFADGTLYLYFMNTTSIRAGVPYIIKWASGNNLTETDLVFTNVQIPSTTPATVSRSDTKISFIGTYSPVNIEANDKSKLFLGSGSTLYYPSADMTVNACRGYFSLDGITAGDPNDPSSPVKAFVLNFGDETETGLHSMDNGQWTMDNGAWYDLSGRKVYNGQWTMDRSALRDASHLKNGQLPRGVYIHNGKKVVIK